MQESKFVTTILSIQSAVAYGHAGNSSAVFPLQRLGVEVWPVHTVTFSNHTGYGAWRGPLIPASDVREVILGIDDREVLTQCDAVLTGYQGAPEVGQVILEAVELVKSRNPKAVYCCDPVMGDVGRGFYARPGIPEFFRDHVVPVADILSPNLFELEFLAGATVKTMDDVLAAAHTLRARGPKTVLVTSVVVESDQEQVMRMVAVDGNEAWQVETPMIDRAFTGSGDLTTATFLAHLLAGDGLKRSLEMTADTVYGILKATHDAGSAELLLVQAQDELVAPTNKFEAFSIT